MWDQFPHRWIHAAMTVHRGWTYKHTKHRLESLNISSFSCEHVNLYSPYRWDTDRVVQTQFVEIPFVLTHLGAVTHFSGSPTVRGDNVQLTLAGDGKSGPRIRLCSVVFVVMTTEVMMQLVANCNLVRWQWIPQGYNGYGFFFYIIVYFYFAVTLLVFRVLLLVFIGNSN